MASEEEEKINPEKIFLFENLLSKSNEGKTLLEQLRAGEEINLSTLKAWMKKQNINASSDLNTNISGGEIDKLININEAANIVINSQPDKLNFTLAIVLVLVSIAVFVFGINILGINRKPNLKFLSFTNPEDSPCQFNGEYPETWTYKVTNNPISQEILVFMPLEESQQEEPKVKLFILCSKPQNILSLSEYTSEVINRRKKLFANLPIEIKETIFLNREANQLNYAVKNNNINWIFKEVITLDKGIAYQVIYRANDTQYEVYKKTANKIIQSFMIPKS